MSAAASLVRDTRGAVYVEFLIAFMPVFVFFLCLLQLALLFSARLAVEHAAMTGARAAAVVFGDEPGPYKEATPQPGVMTAERRKSVRAAVLVSLAPLVLDDTVSVVSVRYPDATGKKQDAGTAVQPGSMMRVEVEATALCKIAIANLIACDKSGNSLLRKRDITSVAAFPDQGARYAYE
ncbi:MAG: hypothetical protein JWP97_3998 [Labilithrix sp.]|nr:hypothetical protein [Labilithrix sp.]